jgi:hypothetical protein
LFESSVQVSLICEDETEVATSELGAAGTVPPALSVVADDSLELDDSPATLIAVT